jgi:hypothetical protein
MFFLSLLLLLTAVGVCLAVARASLRRLGLDVPETMLWLGLAEEPLPAGPRRRRDLDATRAMNA